MFDIGWTELLVIGVVALIVVGPKDLPGMFRTLGRFTAKARGMAREFTRAMEDAADESGVKDMAGDLKKMTSAEGMGLDAVSDAASKFESWDPMKAAKKAVKGAGEKALSPERAEMAEKINASAAKKATERLDAAAKADAAPKKPAPKKAAAKKPVAKKVAAKKPAATRKASPKPTAKKPATKKPAAKKPATKKAAPKGSK